ncbi:MAG: hypothetical protein ACK4RM_03195 [Flavobacterium sp.]
MKTLKNTSKNLAIPGKPMPQEDLNSLIKEAERCEFLNEREFDKKFQEWRLNRKK